MGIRVEDTLARLAEPDLKIEDREVCGSPKVKEHWEPRVNPGFKQATDVAIKFDQGKPPMSLLSSTALVEIAKVLEFGKNKYAAHNWRKGFIWSRLLDSAMRHLVAFNDGEDKDPESGLSHLAHLGCCVMFLLEFEKTHPQLDDRFKREIHPHASS